MWFHKVIGWLFAASTFAAAFAANADTFTYTSRKLIPYDKLTESGEGPIRGATHITIVATGSVPAKGACVDETITAATDGVYTLSVLLGEGWVFQPSSNVLTVCSNAKTGKLSATISFDLLYYVGGVLTANWAIYETPEPGIVDYDLHDSYPILDADAATKTGTVVHTP